VVFAVYVVLCWGHIPRSDCFGSNRTLDVVDGVLERALNESLLSLVGPALFLAAHRNHSGQSGLVWSTLFLAVEPFFLKMLVMRASSEKTIPQRVLVASAMCVLLSFFIDPSRLFVALCVLPVLVRPWDAPFWPVALAGVSFAFVSPDGGSVGVLALAYLVGFTSWNQVGFRLYDLHFVNLHNM
jgi:hypothetical protein